nr:integrase, catalytic region, zinc finger, CCHC-type, peptidase aspartic, catalytic [Tanacetum cinerariifolium]
MMLLARSITQNFSTHTNNRFRTSSNTRNQAVIQDRVDIQTKNAGNGGNGNKNARRKNKNQAFNAGTGNDERNQIVQPDDNAASEPSYDAKAVSEVIQVVLWIVDSGCSKHMTGNLSLLRNFIEKFMGTVCFGNDHFIAVTGYGDYVQGNLMICHVHYVK